MIPRMHFILSVLDVPLLHVHLDSIQPHVVQAMTEEQGGKKTQHEWHIAVLHGYIKNKRIFNATRATIINMKQDFMHVGLSCIQNAYLYSTVG